MCSAYALIGVGGEVWRDGRSEGCCTQKAGWCAESRAFVSHQVRVSHCGLLPLTSPGLPSGTPSSPGRLQHWGAQLPCWWVLAAAAAGKVSPPSSLSPFDRSPSLSPLPLSLSLSHPPLSFSLKYTHTHTLPPPLPLLHTALTRAVLPVAGEERAGPPPVGLPLCTRPPGHLAVPLQARPPHPHSGQPCGWDAGRAGLGGAATAPAARW